MQANMVGFEEIPHMTQSWILHIYELQGKEGGLRFANNYAEIVKWSKRSWDSWVAGNNVSWLGHGDMDESESFKNDH